MSSALRGDGWREERAESIREMTMEKPAEKPLGVIETDLFCRTCGYNLHTQRVWRDARLGVILCRCPECGTHESAEVASNIGTMWSRQFGQFVLALWLCVVMAGTYWAVSSLSYAQIGYMTLNQATIDRATESERIVAKAICLGFEAIAGFWLATTISLMLLHRNRAWGYVSAALPILALVWTLVLQETRPPRVTLEGWASILNLAQIVSYQMSGFLLGAALGRSMVRKIAAWALPPWALRAVSFLWLLEGKELPAQARK
jgi:hypothetical protein